MTNGKHYPYMKPGKIPSYVHAKSNHPPNILKQIPESVNLRLSDILSDETIFNKGAPPYQASLEKSGYQYKLKFTPKDKRRKKSRARKRNITWFNPPFDTRVKANLGKEFLRIVNECFPKGHTLKPIFKRNTLKLTYSCMPNVKSTIDSHNKSLLHQPNAENAGTELCNCRKKEECALGNKYLEKKGVGTTWG